MLFYLVCFDISNDKNRSKIGKILGRYGDRVQYSVFEIALHSEKDLKNLTSKLAKYVDPDDKLCFYSICVACRKKSHSSSGGKIAYVPGAIVI